MGNRTCELPCIFLKDSAFYETLTDAGTTAASKESPSNEAASAAFETIFAGAVMASRGGASR